MSGYAVAHLDQIDEMDPHRSLKHPL